MRQRFSHLESAKVEGVVRGCEEGVTRGCERGVIAPDHGLDLPKVIENYVILEKYRNFLTI